MRFVFLFIFLIGIPSFGFAQDKQFKYHETQSDPYRAMPESEKQFGTPYSSQSSTFWSRQVNIENGLDVLNDAANEPSLTVDPTNPLRMAIGWRQFDNIQSNFRQAGFAWTEDGGETWINQGIIEPGVFRSDPVLAADNNGVFYYNSLAVQPYECFVHSASGSTWGEGVYAYGGDKQWMTIDRTNGATDGNVYCNWNEFFSACPDNDFTRSTDNGVSYGACSDIDFPSYWTTIHVGQNGEVMTGSATGDFSISTNAGDPSQSPVWESSFVDLGGSIAAGEGPNPSGLLGQIWVDSDQSGGAFNGNIYVASTVETTGNDGGDMMFNRSADGGKTWLQNPVRINDDGNGNYQWMGVMSVAPNGRIDAVWLDARDNPGTFLSALYYSFSLDGGMTWSTNEKLSEAFDPHIGWPNQEKMGDYFHMISDDQGANLAWCGTFTGGQDVYFGRIIQNLVPANEPNAYSVSVKPQPNPFTESTTFEIKGAMESFEIRIYNQIGQLVETLNGTPSQEKITWTPNGVQSGLFVAEIRFESGHTKAIRLLLK